MRLQRLQLSPADRYCGPLVVPVETLWAPGKKHWTCLFALYALFALVLS